MKKKILIIYLCIFIYNHLLSQDFIKIEYDCISVGSPKKYALITNDKFSKYYFLERNNSQSIQMVSEENYYIIKDFWDSNIYYKNNIFGNDVNIIDTLFTMKWVLTGKNKIIIGYECQEAKTYFRGRYYTAFYTPQISYPDGPWKFNGLPGLILEVFSDDDEYKFTAQNIITNYQFKISKNYKNLDYITFFEYCQKFIDHVDKSVIYNISKEDHSMNVSHQLKLNYLEIIYPKFQLSNGYAY